MEIEIAQPERMSQSGSSLMRLIQNNDMPSLDLFVRESVQNSLDAAIPGVGYVNMQFLTGQFDSRSFRQELEGISDQLGRRFPEDEYEYLAVRDTNTVGLTGPVSYTGVSRNKYGNLLKLVYEICKPQDQAGAGGSWGIGKTVYFRMGTGLVLYYSRIRITENHYESRLAATLVEDENRPDCLIPHNGSGPSRGIAWWGRPAGGSRTEPVTDEAEIARILGEFSIRPYQGFETGTTIIIPYIRQDELLRSNAVGYLDRSGNPVIPFWRGNISDYLRIALQRWYAPRLNNQSYPHGCFLRAMVNGKGLALGGMEPVFRLVQQLYNFANSDSGKCQELSDTALSFGKERISLRKVFAGDGKAGVLAWAVVGRTALGMGHPDNKPSPFMYINSEIRRTDCNPPLISFCRKPGMIVSYETAGKWADGIPASDPDHYVLAVFSLNSENRFAERPEYTLEEYVRKSEMADHTSWSDWSDAAFNPTPVSNIQRNVIKKLADAIGNDNPESRVRQDFGLGRLLGEMLLPPENFGKAGSAPKDKPASSIRTLSRVRSVSLGMGQDAISYFPDGTMTVKLELRSAKPFKAADVCTGIDSVTGTIRAADWMRQTGLQLPFELTGADAAFGVPRGEGYDAGSATVSALNMKAVTGFFRIEMLSQDSGEATGIRISGDSEHRIKCSLTLHLRIRNREFRTVYYLEEKETEA